MTTWSCTKEPFIHSYIHSLCKYIDICCVKITIPWGVPGQVSLKHLSWRITNTSRPIKRFEKSHSKEINFLLAMCLALRSAILLEHSVYPWYPGLLGCYSNLAVHFCSSVYMVSEVQCCLLTSAIPLLLGHYRHQFSLQRTAIVVLLNNAGALLTNIFLITLVNGMFPLAYWEVWTVNKFSGLIQ